MVELRFGTLAEIAQKLRRDSRASVVATGALPPLNAALYVHDEVDATIERWRASPTSRLLVLTGSAGHGKSAAIAVALGNSEPKKLVVRPDATHADAKHETYREGLRRFLDQWQSGDDRKYILGINLGRALDFFSLLEDRERYPELAIALNREYDLGLPVDDRTPKGITLVDLSTRVQPIISNDGLDVPLFGKILENFDPLNPESIIADAWAHQLSSGLGKYDPLLANIRLLSHPEFRRNLVEAVASTMVRHGVHVTPRRLLDLISRMILPPSLEPYIGADGMWTAAAVSELSSEMHWGKRKDQTLLHVLFPNQVSLLEVEDDLVRQMRHENPTYVRSRQVDDRVMSWSSDATALASDIPPWFLEYLGWNASRRIGSEGTRLLIQVAAWTAPRTRAPERVKRVVDFITLADGLEADHEKQRRMLELAIRQAVTRSHFRVMAAEMVRNEISVQVHRAGTALALRTELERFHVQLDPRKPSKHVRAFKVRIQRPDRPDIPLEIDWPTYDLLCSIYAGEHPGTSRRSSHVIESLLRVLQTASYMDRRLTCVTTAGRVLRLTRDNTSVAARMNAEVTNA